MQNLITYGGRIYSISKKQCYSNHPGFIHIFQIICCFVCLLVVIIFGSPDITFSSFVSAQSPQNVDLAILDISLSNEFPNESEEISIIVVVQDLHDNGSGRLHFFATVHDNGINRTEEIHTVDISGLGHAYIEEINWTVLRNTTKITAYIDNQTVLDENCDNNIASINIAVNNKPIAVLHAQTNETLSLVPVIFDASSSYDEDGIFAYKFDFGDGSGTAWQSLPNASHIYTRSSSKAYLVKLVVRDTKGLESVPASFEILVNNRLPIIKAYISTIEVTPYETYNITSIDSISFSSVSLDVDGEIVNVSWDFGDGCVSYVANTTHKFSYSEIPYIVQLHVTDNLCATNETSFKVRVENIPPLANFSIEPNGGDSTTIFCFDASSSYDLDGDINTYVWNFGDGTTAYGRNVQHKFYSYGVFNISLIVIDNLGSQSVPCIKRLVVDNTPANARFFYTTDSQDEIYTCEIVIFNASLSEDVDGADDGMIYLWNFGDGFMGTGAVCEHVYSKPGIYEIELVVVDSAGAPAKTSKTIEIKNRVPRIVTFDVEPQVVSIRDIVRFSIIAEDLDGNISRFVWDFDGDGEAEKITEVGNTSYVFERLGNYLVSVKIFDDLGIFNSTSIQISVVSSESGFGGIFRFATAACWYAIFMFIVVFLCVIVWYLIIKTNVNKIGLKIRFKKDLMDRRKDDKVKKIETKEIETMGQTNNENKEFLEKFQIDKIDVNKNKEKVELMPAMEKVITYEIEKIEDENLEDVEYSENKFASAVVEEEKLDNKQKMEKSEEKEKNEIKVEFMEIESELKGKADIELKSIRSDELIKEVKTDLKEEITKTILPSKDSERALAEKEEAKKTVKRLKLAEDKLRWCEERLEELTKAGVLSEAEKEDIAGPIRLGRTYVRSKNASKAEKFARRAEEEAKHYLSRLKK